MFIRTALQEDLPGLLALYAQLHGEDRFPKEQDTETLWQQILDDPGQRILLGIEDNKIVSSCVLVIVKNLTRGQRSWAVIENVVTDAAFRKKGYATSLLNRARDIAKQELCYKIMLMTGSKEESTLRFYEQAGYNRTDKTAFIQWLL